MRDISRHVRRFEKENRRKPKNNLTWLKHIEVIDMLEQLEIENISKATSDEVLFSCPFTGHAHGDEKPSCYMNDGSKNPALTTVFKCHGCNRSGNAISFLSEHMGISKQKAANELRDHYAPGYRKPKFGSIAKEFDERLKTMNQELPAQRKIVLDSTLYEQFKIDWRSNNFSDTYFEYLLSRGFTPEDLSYWKIGYDYKSDRITIPIFDSEGNFVGVKARAWKANRKPKYLILGDREDRPTRYGFEPYEKSLIVFGLDKWQEQKTYVFVEGEIDVISLWKMKVPAICTGGASMSDVQAQLIKDHCDEVILFLDDDLAGSNAVSGIDKEDGEHKPGIVETLEPFVRVRLVGKHKYDPNDYLVKNKNKEIYKLIHNAESSFKLNL
jgi:DNA primase